MVNVIVGKGERERLITLNFAMPRKLFAYTFVSLTQIRVPSIDSIDPTLLFNLAGLLRR